MRWFIQILVMLGDLFLLVACFIVLKYLHPIISIPVVYATYRTWRGQGGGMAWTHPKLFLENAKKYGL